MRLSARDGFQDLCNLTGGCRVIPHEGGNTSRKVNQNIVLFMKHTIRYILGAALLSGLVTTGVYAEDAPTGFVDFGKFSPPGSGGEFVEVNIKSNLISMVARLAEKSEPQVAELIRGLQSIRVNVIGLNAENRAEIETRFKSIRNELDAKHWERIVTAQQAKEDVAVFLKTRGDESVEGLAVTVIGANHQAVLVNIVGDIRPEKVAMIGERFNIEPLKKVGQTLEKK